MPLTRCAVIPYTTWQDLRWQEAMKILRQYTLAGDLPGPLAEAKSAAQLYNDLQAATQILHVDLPDTPTA